MIYFDNAASGGRKPDSVQNAVAAAIKVCANPGRSGHRLALACANLVQSARNELNEFFHGYGFDRAVFTKNCTEALNIALFGVLKKGDHAVVTPMEHNSVLRPLEYLKKLGVITYDVCELSSEGNVTPQAVAALIRPNTRLVAVTAASNVTGETPPLESIRAAIPKDVLFLCDGAQGGGHIPLHMQETGIDLLTLAGHKGLMAIQGSGALLFSERVDPTPLLYGGTGSLSVSLDMPDFYPDGLEAGTIAYPAVVSLLEGVRYLAARFDHVQARAKQLTEYLLTHMQSMPEYRVYSKPNACGIVAFAHERLQSEYVAGALSSRYGIAVRGGLHCAPLMHEALGTLDNGLVRVSFSHFNSEREIDELLVALSAIKGEKAGSDLL
ncbi:MAG: aminotransferase class V-fold PLP-dependent enzyme [Clostridia bacterium]|nr:aminotransferase class V-fold PLP-dependent enzyme [Clostridia bacterium]